jgi:hypothetical protein
MGATEHAGKGWFVTSPDLTVAKTRELKRNGRTTLGECLDTISN